MYLFSKLFSARKGKESANRFAGEFTIKDSSAYDFLWMIKSFSKVIGDNEGRQISGRFESKRYSWKLVIYPNGNIVNGQISLYLVLSNASPHPPKAAFKISYELFLFDQKTGGTLSKKGENVAQVRDEMGFRSMIDLKSFRHFSNGYLVKDSCMLGVKILQIILIQTPNECLHPMEKVSHECLWKIENFSKLNKKTSYDKKFTGGNYLWTFRIYPELDQNVYFYVLYHGSFHDPSVMKVAAEITISILDQIEGYPTNLRYNEVLKCDGTAWGSALISLKDFYDPELGFIVNDTCIIKVEVLVHALVE